MPTVVNTETAAAAKRSISMMRSLAWRMAFLARRSLTVCRSGALFAVMVAEFTFEQSSRISPTRLGPGLMSFR